MATLVLTAVGTAIGGPIGGAIGGFLGQQVDREIFGPGPRQSPRLRELSVTTSSYGQPVPRHFGRMRVAGTVIWATDLVETSSTQGGKGQPKSTTYNYSASFAVALSSTPISRVGRIWADGNLLRGAGDDLKVEGQMRVYEGYGDSAVDPLIAADQGNAAPAFRDCAYIVFEDLALANFGNRIPALTFEIFAENDAQVGLSQIVPGALDTSADLFLANTRGFADEGGPIAGALSAIDRVFPLTCATTRNGLRIASAVEVPAQIITLSAQLSGDDSADASERHKQRAEALGQEPMALRYYDEERDYQPGVQRAIGSRPTGREVMLDMPATMTAAGAKELANENAHRARWRHERITWRIGELDPALEVGGVVKLPDTPGLWRVMRWEWYDRGIELGLERLAPGLVAPTGADAGVTRPPLDLAITPTHLQVFEAPADGTTNPAVATIIAAVTSEGAAWNGAALFAQQGDALVPIGNAGSRRALTGTLVQPLASSPALVLEPAAMMEVALIPGDFGFVDTDIAGLAAAANRLLVGGEVVQFMQAEALPNSQWRLSGLLRGRAGTEDSAHIGHPADTVVVGLDDRLTVLDADKVRSDPASRIAAIGRGDDEAVMATLANPGLSRRPPVPVHPVLQKRGDLSWELCWTRRARGHWRWETAIEVPLVEESERYLVGYGPVDSPFAAFSVTEPRIVLTQTQRTELIATHGPANLWVRQIGTYSNSSALLLAQLNLS